MKRTYSYFLLFLLFILGACRDEPIDVEDTVITQFSFLMENNSGLAYSVDFNISTTKISGTLPPELT